MAKVFLAAFVLRPFEGGLGLVEVFEGEPSLIRSSSSFLNFLDGSVDVPMLLWFSLFWAL